MAPAEDANDGAPSPCALSLALSQSVYFPGSTVQCRVEVRERASWSPVSRARTFASLN
jgi:hypothetical protein